MRQPPAENLTRIELVVPPNEARLRLDQFLAKRLPEFSRSRLQQLIRDRFVRLNNSTTRPRHIVRGGDKIELTEPPPEKVETLPEAIPLEILFEDDDLIIINKPAGLVVHPGAGHREHTLVNALLNHCAALSGIGGKERPGIVHRLDKDTSGCLVVAKNDETHLALSEQFAGRTTEKTYLAILCGEVSSESGEIHAAIARHTSHRKRMAVSAGEGRDAWTSYRVTGRLLYSTLVEADLHTGRTHQIRVHFQHLGFPVAGDGTYGAKQTKALAELTGYHAPRFLLHAHRLACLHPRTKRKKSLTAPWPADFQE